MPPSRRTHETAMSATRRSDAVGENAPVGVVVAAVGARTPAARAGLLPGDRILAINGAALRDVIDFHFQAGEEWLELTFERDGQPRATTLRRRGADLGLELEAPRPSEISTCANKCVFCFIHQLPRGMRKSLYVKDDDFRLSFLHGNYITLTDLEEPALRRIEEQRLSPLYVSVPATEPELRHRLLGQPRIKRELMPIMERLCRAGIAIHAQIVLCPDWNDGAHLERSIRDLARLHPGVRTAAIVPVGLTRHRDRLPALRRLEDEEARVLAIRVTGWQREFLAGMGTRFVFAGDEVYLQAGTEPPFARGRARLPSRLARSRRVTVVTGDMFAPRLRALLESVRVDGLEIRLVPIA